MTTTSNNHRYITSDTALATYLILEGFGLLEIDYSQPRYQFVFDDKINTLNDFANKYITGKALVDPATFTRVNRKLLRLLKNELQWQVE